MNVKRYISDRTRRWEESNIAARFVASSPEMRLVKVYPNVTRQTIVGFGAALTEASGYVFSQMDEQAKTRFLELCFGRGYNRYSLCRLAIQSCDFSLVSRSYLCKRDDSLATFSIDDDWAYILPLVKAAQSVNPNIEFLATPWSPPAWAKTNRNMNRGGKLRRDSYDIWARMIVETLRAYRDAGVEIGRLSIQNEPQASQTWESCLFDAKQEQAFLHDYLKPALRSAGLDGVKSFIWDHNKEGVLDRACSMFGDHGCAEDIDGVAFHWYSGDHFEALRATRELVGPNRELLFTEGCDSYSAGDPMRELPHAEHYAHEIIGDLVAGANGIIDWNILLDADGGPNHVGNYCDAPIMYDVSSQRMNVRLPFYYLGHFTRFVEPGATCVLATSYTSDLETCAFANPNGTFALVVLNRTNRAIPFGLTWASHGATSRLAQAVAPAHSIQTLCW